MTNKQKNLLFASWAYCDEMDKSTEFMLQFMADEAEVDYDTAVEFVCETSEEERQKWYKEEYIPFIKNQMEKTNE